MLLQLTLLGAVALPAPVEAQVRDRRVDWHTVRTEHFEVHYPEPLGVVARRAAATAEEAHRRLSTILAHDVDRRVQVVLTDDSELNVGLRSASSRTACSAPTCVRASVPCTGGV